MPADPEVRPKPKSPVFRSLQAGRGIAALCVVLYHCGGLFTLKKYWGSEYDPFLFGASGVDFFFVLSGIVILHAHLTDIERPSRLGGYLQKRLRRIYPIYWVVLFALLPLYFLVPSFGDKFVREPGAIFDAITLLPAFSLDTIIPVAWTLEHEILFYLVFALLLLSRRWGTVALGVWLTASVVLQIAPQVAPSNFIWIGFLFSPLHLLFGMGMLGRLLWQRVDWKGTPLALLGVAGFAACAVEEVVLRRPNLPLPLMYGFFALLACLGGMLVERHEPPKIPSFLMLLGDASYSLYLVHYAVLSASAKLVYRLSSQHHVPLAIPFVLLLAVALTAGVLLHLYVEAPLLRWMNRRPTAAAVQAV